MSELVITVRGEARADHRPEQGTVWLSAAADDALRAVAVDTATTAAAALRDRLAALEAAGAVASWSAADAAVWSDRPWTGAGPSAEEVHHVDIRLSAVFVDLDALTGWADAVAADPRHRIHSVDWALTPATHARLERDTAVAAVAAARERALAYAAAVGRTDVEPVEIADAGLLSGATEPEFRAVAKTAMPDAGAPGFGFAPADVVVTATVDVRFRAG